jgi:hypothetical protein
MDTTPDTLKMSSFCEELSTNCGICVDIPMGTFDSSHV